MLCRLILLTLFAFSQTSACELFDTKPTRQWEDSLSLTNGTVILESHIIILRPTVGPFQFSAAIKDQQPTIYRVSGKADGNVGTLNISFSINSEDSASIAQLLISKILIHFPHIKTWTLENKPDARFHHIEGIAEGAPIKFIDELFIGLADVKLLSIDPQPVDHLKSQIREARRLIGHTRYTSLEDPLDAGRHAISPSSNIATLQSEILSYAQQLANLLTDPLLAVHAAENASRNRGLGLIAQQAWERHTSRHFFDNSFSIDSVHLDLSGASPNVKVIYEKQSARPPHFVFSPSPESTLVFETQD